MDTKTDLPISSARAVAPSATTRKPRVALFVATACGLGHMPFAPGTWGSLAGLLLSWALLRLWPHTTVWEAWPIIAGRPIPFIVPAAALWVGMSALGVWAAEYAARYLGEKDPQSIVIDEVSGQMLPLLFAFGPTERYVDGMSNFYRGFWWHGDTNWKYLLLGLILFRVFDIWKPFPVRQAESFPGGWGIMADDWVAGIYAAIGLWIVRMFGL